MVLQIGKVSYANAEVPEMPATFTGFPLLVEH